MARFGRSGITVTQSVHRRLATHNRLSKDPFSLVGEDKIDIDELNGLPPPARHRNFFTASTALVREAHGR